MFKITFEKVVIITLVLILFLSTTNIFTQYYKQYFTDDHSLLKNATIEVPNNNNFSLLLDKANKYYSDDVYDEAISAYTEVLLKYSNFLSDKQKSMAIFSKSISYYRLGEYKKAHNSFLEITGINSNDALAYNNASVCAYLDKDYELALLNIQKALDIIPTVEYYYNMGRIRETVEEYREAAKYFTAVWRAEENLSVTDRIDPVQLKNKVQNLIPQQSIRDELANEILIALKLKDFREVLTIEDSNMELKSKDFDLLVENKNGVNIIKSIYDREKSDPYNLIKEIKWTITKNGRRIYSNNNDKFTLKLRDSGDYKVNLNIKYSNIQQKELNSYKTFEIEGNKSKIDKSVAVENTSVTPLEKPKTKRYLLASYEQLFEKNFDIGTHGYTDYYNVTWGKDNIETETRIIEAQKVDSGGSLYIKNTSDTDEGIWANLSALLDSTDIKGKNISILFWARKVTDNAKLEVKLRASSDSVYTSADTFELDNRYRWSEKSIGMYVPDTAVALTFSLFIKPEEEVEIDGFRLVIHK